MDEVIDFIIKNKNYYPEYLEKDRLKKCICGYTCAVNQIYCYLKKIDIKKTEYYNFYKICCKHFELQNKKIIEVGCGYIPILASIFKESNYNIIAIDSKILITNYKNVLTLEHDLSKKFNLSNYDLVVGFRPCNITENIIDMCDKYKKDFIIYLCPCIHVPKDKNIVISSYQDWLNYIIKKVKILNILR